MGTARLLGRAALTAVVAASLALGTGTVAATAKDVDLRTSSRSSVAKAYNTVLAPALKVKTGWTGSSGKCRLGKESAASRKATRKAVNFVRALNQLDEIKLSSKLNKRALRTALLMQANGSLSHSPSKKSFTKCWTNSAKVGASRSNLYLSWGYGDLAPSTGARAIVGYMTDSGSGNLAVGHRRWILNPTTRVMATGSTSTANALTVTGTKTSKKAARPTYLEWPAKGWFPTQLEPDGRWSLSASSKKVSFAKAKVKVQRITSKGKVLKKQKVRVHRVQDGYGPNTLVFTVKGVKTPKAKKTVRYKVTVTGIKGAKKSRYSYTVKLFDPTKF
ncbi:MAG: CAP domain-containing protein [Actinomycetales bacterium]|nr:CAP domain-containing protein [Actinomycetales bacterium]